MFGRVDRCRVIFQIILPLSSPANQIAWSLLPYDHPFVYAITSLWAFFFTVIIVGNVMWYVLATGYQIFSIVSAHARADELRIIPNAPDGNGGLACVGDVAFGMATVAGCGMPMVFIWILLYGPNPQAVAGSIAYSVFVTIVFFLPLFSTHKAMKRAKYKALVHTSALFQNEYERLPEAAAAEEKNLADRLDLMKKIEDLYTTIKAMPVWPFDSKTLLKYFFFVLTPLISVVFNLWLVPAFKVWLKAQGYPNLISWVEALAKQFEKK